MKTLPSTSTICSEMTKLAVAVAVRVRFRVFGHEGENGHVVLQCIGIYVKIKLIVITRSGNLGYLEDLGCDCGEVELLLRREKLEFSQF